MNMQSPVEIAIDLLKKGEIPSSIEGLTYFDLRPEYLGLYGDKYNTIEIVKACSQIMRDDPSRREAGQQFLSDLYKAVLIPALKKNSTMPIEDNETLLHWAAATGQDVAFDGFNKPKDLIALDNKKRSPLDLAVQHGHYNVVKRLLELDVKPSEENFAAIMTMVCEHKDIKLAKQLLESGLSPTEESLAYLMTVACNSNDEALAEHC
jgi:hypothetical protein